MKKILLTGLLLILISVNIDAQRINEFHYENDGGDVGEFVEVFIPDPQPADIDDWDVVIYNGSTQGVLSTLDFDTDLDLSNTGMDVTGTSGTFYLFNTSLQNSTEGLALVDGSGTVIQFISYEGTITAADGPAMGQTSTDVGVSQSNTTTPVGASIEFNPNTSTWFSQDNATPGNVNLLPVELANFTATPISENEVALSWTTASEEENDYFQIEKSRDGQKFEVIGKVKGAGNSLEQRTYQFVDDAAKVGVSYYRLAQFNYDGTMEYHQVVVVAMKDKNAKVEVYPTLVNDELNINLEGNATVSIMNISGALVKEVQVFNFTTLDVSDLMTGTYFLVIQGERFVEALRVVKQ